jgi:hypothetical protein
MLDARYLMLDARRHCEACKAGRGNLKTAWIYFLKIPLAWCRLFLFMSDQWSTFGIRGSELNRLYYK